MDRVFEAFHLVLHLFVSHVEVVNPVVNFDLRAFSILQLVKMMRDSMLAEGTIVPMILDPTALVIAGAPLKAVTVGQESDQGQNQDDRNTFAHVL